MERRLAAILAADVVGYSRLMGDDEEGTLARLKAHRDEVTDPTIHKHRGRIVKLMGDGVLVEFASVADAVICAVEIQRSMVTRNEDVPEGNRIEFRIGINLGDVIHDGDDIYGDGVNVAARLESLADPGGICISDSVRAAVGKKLPAAYLDIGKQKVKNIEEPVQTYRVLLQEEIKARAATSKRRLIRYVAITTLGLIATGAGVTAWLKPWEPASAPLQFATDTAGRGLGRQGVKAGRLNLKLSLPVRWDAQVIEEEDLDLQGFETDASTVLLAWQREKDGKINPQVVVAKDQEGVAHFRIFKWYKFLHESGQKIAHDWMQKRGYRHILDRYAGGEFYKETRGDLEVGPFGSGEELTMIPFELQVKGETRFVWIAYVVRENYNPKEITVFFFHNGENAAEISKDLVLAVTDSATNMFPIQQ
jgi:class 3 adenylate cyclase